jgi:hypothetical protein
MLEDLKPISDDKPGCRVAVVAGTLSDKDAEILFAAIADKGTWPIKTLRKALQAKGLEISDTPLTSHRAQTCICYRVG